MPLIASCLQQTFTRKRPVFCLKNHFKGVLLLVNFNEPFYENIPLLKSLYGDVFPNMVFYGTNASSIYQVNKVDTHKGYFSYIVIAHAMEHYENYTGYFLINDDALLNPWNLVRLDRNKIWEGPKWPITIGNFSKFEDWYWWRSRWGLENCASSLKELTEFYQNLHLNLVGISFMRTLHENTQQHNHSNNNRSHNCHRGRSDVVYVPKRFLKEYIVFSELFHRHKVFLEIAFPTLLRMLDASDRFEKLDGIYLPGRVKTAPVSNSSFLWIKYNDQLDFIHPVKMNYGRNSETNHIILRTFFKRYMDVFTDCPPPV